MNIDYYNELKYLLSLFYPLYRKSRYLTTDDIEQMIVIIYDIQELLESYLYDYLNY